MPWSHPLGQKLVVGKAGTLEYYPPVAHGQPASGEITILLPDGAALPAAVSGAVVTVDPVSTTLTADPALGTTQITVASAADLAVGRSYILETGSRRELVVVIGIATLVLTLQDELQVDHASGSTLKGHRLSYDLASTQQAAAERNVQADLTWEDEDGTDRYGGFAYHVVHRPWRLPTSDRDVLGSAPDAQLQRALRGRGASFADLLDDASVDLARMLRRRGYVEDQFLAPEAFVPLHVAYVRRRLVEARWANDPDRLERLGERWDERIEAEWDAILRRLPPYDGDNDGVLDAAGEEDIQERAEVSAPTGWQDANPDGVDSDDWDPEFAKKGTDDWEKTAW